MAADQNNTSVSDHPDHGLKHLGSTLLRSNSLVPTFLRSAVSSQASGWVDFIVGFVMFYWIFNHHLSWLATGIGVVAGGIVNCIICYKFTFRAENCSWSAVVVKYALVWIGNLILNSAGTDGLYMVFKNWPFLEEMGFKPAGYYAAARLLMSLLVSWFWNFILQRNFVYRPSRFDPYAERFMASLLDFLHIHHKDRNPTTEKLTTDR
ncbi:MAG: GtrA family protein [Muribaculaceae bacterium]|nr:GtrA family protein [Muribaculaceae bacterium]